MTTFVNQAERWVAYTYAGSVRFINMVHVVTVSPLGEASILLLATGETIQAAEPPAHFLIDVARVLDVKPRPSGGTP